MSWETVKLGDCCVKIGSGATPKGGATVYIETGTALIRSQNVYNLAFDYQGLTYITEDAAKKLNGVTVYEKDVLLNITGDSVARVCMVPNNVLPARVNQHVAILRTNENLLPEYLLYYLASPHMQVYMLNLAVGKGASRNALTKGMIEDFPLLLPSVEEQKNIVKYLSAYDDLIENNQKQIKLLEEAAQRLYKEWFVDFRFPGYENTPIIDGVPQGWRKSVFSDVFTFVRGKSYTSKELSESDGVLMVNLKNIRAYGGYKRNAEKRFTGMYKEEQLLVGGDVVMGITDMTQERRLVGHVALIPSFNEKVTFSMDLIKLMPYSVSKNYLYCALQYGGYSEQIAPLANGVNVLHLKPEAMMKMEMLVPDENTMQTFDVQFEAMRLKSEALEKQCNLAVQARDRLLPKLMSGELEV